MDKKVIILWLLTVSFWGVSPIIEKLALKNVEPLVALFIRTGISLVVMGLILPFTSSFNFSDLTFRDYFFLGLSGITGGFLGMLTYFSLLKYENASKIVPLTATYPLVATFLGILILKESFSLNKLLGAILVTLGIILLLRTP